MEPEICFRETPVVDLPGVWRKLHNMAQRTDAKRATDRSPLEEALARIVDAT